MRAKLFLLMVAILFATFFSSTALAQMTGDNFRISTSTLSGGGSPSASENYQLNSTIGQQSPLPDGSDPPMSNNYDLYPGFWYTLSAGVLPCEDLSTFAQAFGTIDADADYNIACDSESDGDIDGVDLSDFLQGYAF